MSVQAVKWALDVKQTGPLPAEARLVLLVMADRADKDGRNVYLAASTIAQRLGTTDRSVRRHLSTLRDKRVIVPGDPDVIPEHYRHDRRPVVYDLPIHAAPQGAIAAIPDPSKMQQRVPPEWLASFDSASRPDSAVIPLSRHGVTALSARPDSAVRHGVTALSSKTVCRSINNPNRPRHHLYVTWVGRLVGALGLTDLRDGMDAATRWRFA